jgi:hypothetical protein
MSVLVLAGSVALVSATMGDILGATIGLLAAGAGAMELHGVTVLHHGDRRGMTWLVGSQVSLLVVVLGYCALQLVRAKVPVVPAELEPMIRMNADLWEMTSHDFLLMMFNRVLYSALAFTTVVYQSGMALYYLRRRAAVGRALEAE